MKLFHFTHLFSLPRILREGINNGDVPISPDVPSTDRPNAANLTRNKNRGDQLWCLHESSDKTAIRLTVECPDGELTSFSDVVERYNTSSDWVNKLGAAQHRKQWFYAFGGVRPDQIQQVERLVNGQYRKLSQNELQTLITAIDKEIDQKFTVLFVTKGGVEVVEGHRFKDGHVESWLMDGLRR